MCQHNLPCSIVYAHCLLPGRAFASLYVLLFLEKEAEIGGREKAIGVLKLDFHCIVRCFKQEKGQKRVSTHYRQCKIDTASVYKLLFSSLVESATLKKDKGRLH